MFTLESIERMSQVPVARLRYLADSKLFPGNRHSTRRKPRRGVVRTFTPLEVFGMLIALSLLDAGIRREKVAMILDFLGRPRPGIQNGDEVPLAEANNQKGVHWLEIGDGVNVRFEKGSPVGRPMSQVWTQLNTGAALQEYEPSSSVRINLARLRNLLAAQK